MMGEKLKGLNERREAVFPKLEAKIEEFVKTSFYSGGKSEKVDVTRGLNCSS